MAKHRYFVTGRGQFPDDMLRYDRAKVICALSILTFDGKIIEGECPPTIGRWQSFLWHVMPMQMRSPGGDPENGPAEWHVKIGIHWESIKDYFNPRQHDAHIYEKENQELEKLLAD